MLPIDTKKLELLSREDLILLLTESKELLPNKTDERKLELWRQYKQSLKHMPYGDYLQSGYWNDVKALAHGRDGARCRECDSCASLQVHHNNYEFRADEVRMLHTVETLCDRCHEKRHEEA